MAEGDKKNDREEEKKEKPKTEDKTLSEIFFEIFIAFVVFTGLARALQGGLTGKGPRVGARVSLFLEETGITRFIHNFFISFSIFVNILCILFIIGIVYTLIRIHQYELEAQKDLYPGPEEEEEIPEKNPRWQGVLNHINSENPSDWRLAILECDIVLDELLDKNGYIGDTIGDKLKQAVKGDFKTLDNAWEAHRIRNAIAHEGQDFMLTQREALRVVNLYESVFREFDFI